MHHMRIDTDADVAVRTCWLMSRMATSLRSVNSWKAASMVDIWVSRKG